MKAFESTMSNIEKYLEEKNEAYKKINTKMAQGFIYKVVNGDVSYTVNVKVDEKLGFVKRGETFFEAGIEHVEMEII